jgi:hypothetical protein
MGFIPETEGIDCAVRAESLSIIQLFFVFRPTSVHVGPVVDRMILGQVCSESKSVFSCQYHSASAAYTPSPTHCPYKKDKRAKPVKLPKAMRFKKIGRHWTEKYTFT